MGLQYRFRSYDLHGALVYCGKIGQWANAAVESTSAPGRR